MLTRFPPCRSDTITPEFGLLANPCHCSFFCKGSLSYKWQVLFTTTASGKYSVETIQSYIDQLSGYKLCPGISKNHVEIFVSKRRICVSEAFLSTSSIPKPVCGIFQTLSIILLETHFKMHVPCADDWPRTFVSYFKDP